MSCAKTLGKAKLIDEFRESNVVANLAANGDSSATASAVTSRARRQ